MTTDYNNRAARGQAYNLAVNDAIANGKSEDTYYISRKFIHYYNLGSLFQEIDIEDLKKELNKDE